MTYFYAYFYLILHFFLFLYSFYFSPPLFLLYLLLLILPRHFWIDKKAIIDISLFVIQEALTIQVLKIVFLYCILHVSMSIKLKIYCMETNFLTLKILSLQMLICKTSCKTRWWLTLITFLPFVLLPIFLFYYLLTKQRENLRIVSRWNCATELCKEFCFEFLTFSFSQSCS